MWKRKDKSFIYTVKGVRKRKRQRYLLDFELVFWEASSRRSRGGGVHYRGKIMCCLNGEVPETFIWRCPVGR